MIEYFEWKLFIFSKIVWSNRVNWENKPLPILVKQYWKVTSKHTSGEEAFTKKDIKVKYFSMLNE